MAATVVAAIDTAVTAIAAAATAVAATAVALAAAAGRRQLPFSQPRCDGCVHRVQTCVSVAAPHRARTIWWIDFSLRALWWIDFSLRALWWTHAS